MHFNHASLPREYCRFTSQKFLINILSLAAVLIIGLLALTRGPTPIPIMEVIKGLFQNATSERINIVIWNIRLPQILIALVAGSGLAWCGTVMQSVLRNPLGSPFTLGVSHGAAFGAALSVIFLLPRVPNLIAPYLTTLAAFSFSLATAGVIMAVSRAKAESTEAIILTGVALASLFTAGTMFLQYFADDIQLAAMVFWTFGDLARTNWKELAIISAAVLPAGLYFQFNCWNYNALDCGEDTARGLGVNVNNVRLFGMMISAIITAVIISFVGIIGFVGLVCPHIARRLIGNDHRFLLPFAGICGAGLLLGADTIARTLLAPHVLPVSILTAFCGAPVFFWLIIRRNLR